MRSWAKSSVPSIRAGIAGCSTYATIPPAAQDREPAESLMSDRKYRQRGYQDEPRESRERKPEQKKEYAPRGQPPIQPKTFNMPGFREVVKCARCGHELTVATAWSAAGTCARCGADLHTCAQCAHFDTSAAFECQKPVAARVSPKDARN